MDNTRKPVPFDTAFFEKKKHSGENLSIKETFEIINKNNHWSGNESVSGQGSDDSQTAIITETLPKLISELEIKTFIDIPCGDFNWMKDVNLTVEKYIGGDIVESLIINNNKLYADSSKEFKVINLTDDELPAGDLIFCRDCLVHLSYDDINKAINNIKKSGIKYLLTTTFTNCKENKNITTGDWRILNFTLPPFNFPAPLTIINEGCTEGEGTYSDKSLGLWKVSDI